jgi:hypothetical protein
VPPSPTRHFAHVRHDARTLWTLGVVVAVAAVLALVQPLISPAMAILIVIVGAVTALACVYAAFRANSDQ